MHRGAVKERLGADLKMGLEARPVPLWCAMKPQGAGYEFAEPGGYGVVHS